MADLQFGVGIRGTDIDHVTAVERLQRFVDAGARHFILSPLCDNDVLRHHLNIYAQEILPQFR
jgi:hypothetical protein